MYKNTLNTDGLTFPLDVRDVPKFEKMNESISINVLCIFDEGGFTPLHVSKHPNRPQRVILLPLEGEDDEGNERKHYVCIRNMSALVHGRTKSHVKEHVCLSCLHSFCKQETLERHEPYCQRHPPQHVKYPDPDNCVAEFLNKAARFRLPFYLVYDSNSFCQQSTLIETPKPRESLNSITCVIA